MVRLRQSLRKLLPLIMGSDLEWRLIYVSSPGREDLDQELDNCLVGPIPAGVNSFEFEGSPLNPSIIPPEDVLGVAALILTGSYNEQEFVRVGYYQNTEYEDEELKENPPKNIAVERLMRDINTKPRVTRFQIKWYARAFLSGAVPVLTSTQGCGATANGARRGRRGDLCRRSIGG